MVRLKPLAASAILSLLRYRHLHERCRSGFVRSPGRSRGRAFEVVSQVLVFAIMLLYYSSVAAEANDGGSDSQLFADWRFGKRQEPFAKETMRTRDLRAIDTQTGGAFLLPNGSQLSLARGFRVRETLPDGYALIYRDNLCLMSLDAGSRRPRVLHRPRLKNALQGSYTLSTDGRYFFSIFEADYQLCCIEVSSGSLQPLTTYQVTRNYKNYARLVPGIQADIHFDPVHSRVLYFEPHVKNPNEYRLVAISIPDGTRRVLPGIFESSGCLRRWDVNWAANRIYTLEGAGLLRVRDLSGKTVYDVSAALGRSFVWFDLLQANGSLVLDDGVSSSVHCGNTEDPIAQVSTLPEGTRYSWALTGEMLAFVRNQYEIGLVSVKTNQDTVLARVILAPNEKLPSTFSWAEWPMWSSDGRMLSATLPVVIQPNQVVDYITLLFDLQLKRVVVLPYSAGAMSWARISKHFPHGFHAQNLADD